MEEELPDTWEPDHANYDREVDEKLPKGPLPCNVCGNLTKDRFRGPLCSECFEHFYDS